MWLSGGAIKRNRSSVTFQVVFQTPDTSCGIYSRILFMTVVVVHPEAIYYISKGGYYKDCGY